MKSNPILCRSNAGDAWWSLHAPLATDEIIANRDTPPIANGTAMQDQNGNGTAPMDMITGPQKPPFAKTEGGRKMTYTKGPWEIRQHGDANHTFINRSNGHWLMVLQQNGELTTEEQLSNATMVAATTDMYEALKGMLQWARRVKEENPGPEVFNAVAALMKAERRAIQTVPPGTNGALRQ